MEKQGPPENSTAEPKALEPRAEKPGFYFGGLKKKQIAATLTSLPALAMISTDFFSAPMGGLGGFLAGYGPSPSPSP